MPAEDRKTRIAFVIWTLRFMGGSEHVVYDMVKKLDRSRYSTFVISFADGPCRTIFERVGAKVHAIPNEGRISCGLINDLRQILLAEKVDIVNAHHYHPFVYSFLATRFSRIKLIYTEHSRWQLEKLHPVRKVINRVFCQRCDAVIAISHQIEDYYRNRVFLNKKKIHCITNGVDLGLYGSGNGCRTREELGIGSREKVVGMVAHIRPEKNHRLLISAFSAAVKDLGDVRLALVGKDYMEGEMHALASRSGVSDKVLFLGERKDVPQLLRTFDAFCLTSTHEGMPLVILEAMASGVPVIGSDVLGINEVISHDVNGLLFPNGDERALAEAIQAILTDDALRRRLIHAGRSFVERHYSLDDKIMEYDTLFERLRNAPRLAS